MSNETKSVPSTKAPALLMIFAFTGMITFTSIDGISPAWSACSTLGFVVGFVWFLVQRFRQ